MEFGLDFNINEFPVNSKQKNLDEAYIEYLNLIYGNVISFFNENYESIELKENVSLAESLRRRYLLCNINNLPKIIITEASDKLFADLIKQYPGCGIIICTNQQFFRIIEIKSREKIIYFSRYLQRFLNPKANAYIFKNFFMRLKLCFLPVMLLLGIFYSGLLYYFANSIYFINTIFKIIIFKISLKYTSSYKRPLLEYSELPIYTILIPLYREAAKLQQIIDSVRALNYPSDKLDVKLVIEYDDVQTYKALKLLNIPKYIHILRVPDIFPKTKPKACNYAMQFALGEFVVIYDAEDKPEPDQLLNAVAKYKGLDSSYACLQARLKIEHTKFDILGFLFKLEYEMWFSYLLNGLAAMKLPIPLGGTSNHFRVSALREIGMWDPYNVTEDADIGIRLNLEGYKVGMLDSYTMEEPPMSLKAWLKQRVRWIKGFMVTSFCYLNHDKKKQSMLEKMAVVIFVIFSVISFLVSPIIIMNGLFLTNNAPLLLFSHINLAIFLVFFWPVAYFLIKSSSIQNSLLNIIIIILFPLYFILHSLAAYLALIELLWKPFRWNKTDHLV